MVAEWPHQPFASGAEASAVVNGAVRSILRPPTIALFELPALSSTEAETLTFAPSPVATLSPGTVDGSSPEDRSAAVQWTGTSSWYQPSAFGLVVAAPESVGGVVSTLIPSKAAS